MEGLRLDLVGPWHGHELASECLQRRYRPSNWYMTGFLVPASTPAEEGRGDDDEDDEMLEVERGGANPDENAEEVRASRKSFFPSSMGLSFLVAPDAEQLDLTVHWGDYKTVTLPPKGERKETEVWRRSPRSERLEIQLSSLDEEPANFEVPGSNGLEVTVLARRFESAALGDRLPEGTRSVSVFLVNRRDPDPVEGDVAYAFQPQLVVRSSVPFVPRPDLSGARAQEADERQADLHFADAPELAAGHGVSVDWDWIDDECRELRTEWIPLGTVERTVTAKVPGVDLRMDTLGELADGAEAQTVLTPMVTAYREWITLQEADAERLSGTRRETARQLCHAASIAAKRIERGIEILAEDPDALDAFRVANRAVAAAMRARLGESLGGPPEWRAFQLAFVLLNLEGIADPTKPIREHVDLLFFPTGGGKTEAYLGLAAFTMVLRRLRNDGLTSAGVCVLMRYTLRLLTLDQLGRAAGLVCALELEREKKTERYGDWPFEIGLWVGKAATPNVMGRRGDGRDDTARAKTNAYKTDPRRHPSPVPLETCPWCGERFQPDSFQLLRAGQPDADRPDELRITCVRLGCEFDGSTRTLPILAVDAVIYRRLPAFLIATVDKFAALPFTGESGLLMGGARRHDKAGFYGPCDPQTGRTLAETLLPPDLVIQDELHLISGPMGTMAGLYETALEALATREVNGKQVRPKLVASTATARRAEQQVQALFGRSMTAVFPPPGLTRRDSFFAQTREPDEKDPARLYLGIAAQGRSPKAIFRRTVTTLMAAAQSLYRDAGPYKADNPGDPYMTVLGYFNSLRELGGSRRILEEEVSNALKGYGKERTRIDDRWRFSNRDKFNEVVELTSRVSTGKVADAKRRLDITFDTLRDRVDCALATNMISVGLDIQRLGLMVVMGQPKTHSEYIQATSRVGRDKDRPGLVVTLLNVHKPRDRSHFERFQHYHSTFYRSVEAASVTPFSARALDRGLAGALVGLARHWRPELTAFRGPEHFQDVAAELRTELVRCFRERVGRSGLVGEELEERQQEVDDRIKDLTDSWIRVVKGLRDTGERVRYQKYEPPGDAAGRGTPLVREMLETVTDLEARKFRANRSLRDVEAQITIELRDLVSGATNQDQ